MKHFKIALVLTILMSMVGTETLAQTLIDGIYYNLDSATLEAEVTASAESEYNGKVVIPSSVIYENNTYSVTSIRAEAFHGCTGLTAITIPNSVTSIGEYNQEIKGKTNVEIIPVSA